ncbi:MAG: ABC transporter ATP-binding protein [Porticoccaceae bacterium]|jgi:lipoprotein-releasing system ATP-binding protein
MTNNSVILTARGLVRDYQQGSDEGALAVIRGVDLDILRGEKLAIVGVSGSGKTTLLNLLGGIDDPSAGSVTVCGKNWQHLNPGERAAWRNRHLGFVYQFHHLLGEFSALENVAMPCLIGGDSKAEAHDQASELLSRVGLGSRLHHRPAELSGGERQRVAIARALARKPALVLMDEPTGNLDPKTAESVLDLLEDLNREFAISFAIVTHDLQIAQRQDRVVTLANGRLESQS